MRRKKEQFLVIGSLIILGLIDPLLSIMSASSKRLTTIRIAFN